MIQPSNKLNVTLVNGTLKMDKTLLFDYIMKWLIEILTPYNNFDDTGFDLVMFLFYTKCIFN